jgi:antitoxin HicB
MRTFVYPAKFSNDGHGRILVRFPDLKEAVTDGKDLAEAMEQAIDCVGSDLAHRMFHKEDIPAASPVKRGHRGIPVPFWIAPKLALYLAMRERNLSNSELARRLGVTETVVRRMLNPDHETKAEKIQAALALLGQRLAVDVQDAA